METKRKYVGRVETKNTQYGDIIKIGLGPNDLEMINASKSAKGWVTVDVKLKKDGGYYAEIASYEPNSNYGQPKAAPVNDDLF
jgi:hypothetical protein